LEHRQKIVDARLGVLNVKLINVVANLDGVATHLRTVEKVVRATVVEQSQQQQPYLLLLVTTMLAASSARLFLTECLNIETTHDAKVMDSTLTMLSSLLHDLSMALAHLVMLLHVKGSSRLS
jgi:hypothetical protein